MSDITEANGMVEPHEVAALPEPDPEVEKFRTLRAELAAKNPGREVFVLKLRDTRVICRTLTSDEYHSFKSSATGEKEQTSKIVSAQEKAFRQAVLYPKGEDLADLCRRFPGLPTTFGKQVIDQSGLSDAVEVEKY